MDNTTFDSIDEMAYAVNGAVNRTVHATMTACRADEMGLDSRAGYTLFVNDEYIAVPSSGIRSLEYYGGFEYVDEEYTFVLGDYKFYSTDDDRVKEHIDTYYNRHAEEEEEEEA
jgi:hypothetical protein